MDILGLCVVGFLTWCWYRWFTSNIKAPSLSWRSSLIILALLLVSGSAVLFVGVGIYSRVIGGFEYYSQTFLIIGRLGFWLAISGIIAGIFGKSSLRIHAVVSAVVMLILWFAIAASE